MKKLDRTQLYSLEQYAERRKEFRAEVMAHKLNRRLAIGPNATLYFEDRLTIQYQIQEMLRIEKVFEAAGIEDELETYNPLIPDGRNWKATFMLEYDEPEERKTQLARMLGIDKAVWMKVTGHDAIVPISNEDLQRETETKTSSVHFMRFELTPDMIKDLKQGAAISAGIDHDAYRYKLTPIPENVQKALLKDLD
ncbi:MAG: hypothetical protein ACI909_002644 [Planctomycetota bacterium]|jgi:hypothetical protein